MLIKYGCQGSKQLSFTDSNVIYQSAEDGLADTVKPRLEQAWGVAVAVPYVFVVNGS